MTRIYRLTFLALSFITLLLIGRVLTGNFNFILEQFWFASGILLLILLSLIDQPHFSKDSNIFVNAITGCISLLVIPIGERDGIYSSFLAGIIYLLISSYTLMWIRTRNNSKESKVLQFVSRVNREIGRPEAIFSSFFLWGIYKQFGVGTTEFNGLLLFWSVFIILNLKAVAKAIAELLRIDKDKSNKLSLGQIFGVQSKNTFLVRLYDFSERIIETKTFDFVEFKYSVDKKVRKGILLDTYNLNQEKWVKVLCSQEIDEIFKGEQIIKTLKSDVLYRLDKVPDNDFLSRFVGLVSEDSKIHKIKFTYNSSNPIREGQLLELNVGSDKVLYQVVEGITKLIQLENKNESDLIQGEAIQLGTWNSEKATFEQFGWVPKINTAVFLASEVVTSDVGLQEFVVGSIPGSNCPVILNKETSITHHTAILGVTGSGKSVFTRNLIDQIKSDANKVIVIDLTGEYKEKINGLVSIIDDTSSSEAFAAIEKHSIEMAEFANKRDYKVIDDAEKTIKRKFYNCIKAFLEGTEMVSVFELPDISNKADILEYTKWFFFTLFKIAKTENSFGKRVCVVLEEAHTVIPELNSMGVTNYASKASVNTIAQIALQGRKYDIGFYVIAQRTANVSKTVLTQCNSIICFQVLDKTSSDFLLNYMGNEYIKLLPTLKFRQAIAVGKAFKSNVPMLFEVPEITEQGGIEAE